MITRCTNSNVPGYEDYGGRGITVCDRWLNSFEAFFTDMGPRTTGMTLDRIKNDKGYSLENCRWATKKEQQRNMRSNRIVVVDGVSMTLAEAAERSGFNYVTVQSRLNRGWDISRAISTPARRYG